MRYSRRLILGWLMAGAADLAYAQAPAVSPRPLARVDGVALARGGTQGASVLAAPADELIAAAKLGGEVAYLVADAATGLVLEARGGDRPMPPASTAKTITSLYALEHLGPAFQFRTRLIATGPISGGKIRGDLVFAGGGDPTLGTDQVAEMAAALARQGVTGITGSFLVWGGALPYAHEIADDQPEHVGYNPAVSGIILNYNRVHFQWRRAAGGYQLAMDARSDRFQPAVYTADISLANRERPLFSYSEKSGKEHWTVASAALGKGGSRWLPVRRPALYAGDVFQTLARAQGVTLPAPKEVTNLPGGTVLVEKTSEQLREVLRDMLKFSTNITAEAVGQTTTMARGGGASGKAMTEWLSARSGATRARFVDHSGLGAASRISPREMVVALAGLGQKAGLRGILRHIALRDANGKEVKNHPIRVDAKTGTLNFVSTLAGYMTAPDGTELVFAIFTGDVARRKAAAQSEAPEGSAAWVRRSKRLQQQLIERWGAVYGS